MNAGAAITAACVEQRNRDLAMVAVWRHAHDQRNQTIVIEPAAAPADRVVLVRPCSSCDFWRRRLDEAVVENERIRRYCLSRGVRIPPLVDGWQA